MSSLYGKADGKLDSKRRLSVPVALRRDGAADQTNDRFFLKYGSEGCLQLYPVDEWRIFEEKLRRLLKGNREQRKFVYAFLKDACWVSVDSQGRITIPPALQNRAGLGTDVALRADIDHISIWQKGRLDADADGLPDQELAEQERIMLADGPDGGQTRA